MRDLTSLEKMEGGNCTLRYTSQNSYIYFSLHVCIVSSHSHAHNASGFVQLHITFLSVFVYCAINVCAAVLRACVRFYSSPRLSSQHRVHKMNHVLHKSKELTEAFSYG